MKIPIKHIRLFQNFGSSLPYLAVVCTMACTSASNEVGEKPYKISTNKTSIRFDGQLLGDAAKDISIALKKHTGQKLEKLVIRSAGGHADVALDVGEIVRKNKFDVQVDGYCNSGCASKVFLAGERKILSPGSVVIFHTSPSAVRRVLADAGLTQANLAFSDIVKREQTFYDVLKIDKKLLFGAIDGMIPLCFLEDTRRRESDTFRYGISWAYAAWQPSKRLLDDAGVQNIEGSWPSKAEEVKQMASQYFNSNFTINFVDKDWTARDFKQKIERCS